LLKVVTLSNHRLRAGKSKPRTLFSDKCFSEYFRDLRVYLILSGLTTGNLIEEDYYGAI
jgi:hypothetical protein